MDDNITYGNNKIISSQCFSSIRHPWQRTKWCGLLVVMYMTIKWLYFEQHGSQLIYDWKMVIM